MNKSKTNLVYYLPCRPEAIYLNVTAECLNNCLFCIKRDGPVFFGHNLSLNGDVPGVQDFVEALLASPSWQSVKEVVICGMGEPLLRYDCVCDVCTFIRESKGNEVRIRVDTSGLFWAREPRLDILDHVDILSISLNGESASKYVELCQPKLHDAYGVLMRFLRGLKAAKVEKKRQGICFPRIRLSVVDTSEERCIPRSGRKDYELGTFPAPDIEACKRIAADFGWPLIVKRLFRDSCDDVWKEPAVQEALTHGIAPERCRECSYRH